MNTTVKKILALCLCAALTLGMTGVAFALRDQEPSKLESDQPEPVAAATADSSETPEETKSIFVLTDSSGATQKLMEGEEEIEGEAPLELKLSYWLDDQPMDPAELAGKTGRLRIRADYTVRQTASVELDGREQTVTVPYLTVTGLVLDRAVAENVTVSSGRVHMDDSRIVVVGYALAGLDPALTRDLEALEGPSIPDYLEIEADVQDFSLDMVLTLATTELFRELDPEQLDLTTLTDQMDQLEEAMNQLLDGASQLADGLQALQTGTDALEQGAEQLQSGANQAASGAAALQAGAAQLQSGARQLSDGLNTLNANSASLNAGALQVFQGLLATANQQLAAAGLEVPQLTVSNYDTVLDGVIATLDPDAVYARAEAQVTQAVEANRSAVESGVTEAVRAQVAAQVTETVRAQVAAQVTEAARAEIQPQVEAAVRATVRAQVIQTATGLSVEAYEQAVAAGQIDEAAQADIEAATEQQMASQQVQEQIAQAVETQLADSAVQERLNEALEEQMASQQIQELIEENTEQQMASQQVQAVISQNVEAKIAQLIADNLQSPEVQAQLAAASEGAQSVMNLKISLDSYSAFYQGLMAYTAGVGQAAEGAGTLAQGAAELKQGADRLSAGATALSEGANQLSAKLPALRAGVERLTEGAEALRDGLQQFDDEGVSKLTEAIGSKLQPLAEEIKVVIEAADEGAAVRYIYRSAGIGE